MKEDFQIELLGVYSLEECLEKEKGLAKTSLFPKGLNGNAGRYIEMTEEVRDKLSIRKKGKTHIGTPLSDEHKRKLIDSLKRCS